MFPSNFSIEQEGHFWLKSAAPPDNRIVTATVSSKNTDVVQASSRLNITIHWLPASGLINGLIVRIDQISPNSFITSPNAQSMVSELLALLSFINSAGYLGFCKRFM